MAIAATAHCHIVSVTSHVRACISCACVRACLFSCARGSVPSHVCAEVSHLMRARKRLFSCAATYTGCHPHASTLPPALNVTLSQSHLHLMPPTLRLHLQSCPHAMPEKQGLPARPGWAMVNDHISRSHDST
eukprot:1159677-Pelagomonas_calceolata.AAC.9